MKKWILLFGCLLSASAIHAQSLESTPFTLPEKIPTKIVVMDFGALDTLDALSVKGIVGLPKDSTPKYLAQYNTAQYVNVGGMKSPDIDAIKAAKADFMIISGRQGAAYEQLAQIAPTMKYTADPKNYLNSVQNNIQQLAKIVGKEQEANQQLRELNQKLDSVKKVAQKSSLKALVVLHNEGKLMVSNSSYAQFIHHILSVKQADSQLANIRKTVDAEYLNHINPDIIFIVDRSGAIGKTPFNLNFFDQESFEHIKAIKQNRIVYLTPDLWYLSGNGLQSMALQAQEVSQALKK
ncbi:siderophore ABC transporter substrate-binding protein [Neisseria sp. Ec49-e6-T10]|uniref:siderophore ABC transporter substrate-binding protein n=1 Tax=Neisseria sp. Ec49-e6-T10 TaxID=3140744 RepID=UPI003EBC9271